MEQKDKEYISIKKQWQGKDVQEGDGVMVNRVIGVREMPDIDPFLMLDYLKSAKLPAGFPDHPHRGFETVTFGLKGKFLHEDFLGNKGVIEAGDVQWMTAGRGIVHAEMPSSKTESASGFQLWINLSKEKKMIEPYYQEFKKEQIPVVDVSGNKITLIAGQVGDTIGPCVSTTPTSLMLIEMQPNNELVVTVGTGKNGFVYVFEGEDLKVGNNTFKNCQAGTFNSNDTNTDLKLISGNTLLKMLLIFATPLNQPVAKYGPFVMNTNDELQQAFDDYQKGKNGFEKARQWTSKISELSYK